jgi:TolB-like protein/Tfp pilus assembly protein PilF
MADELVANGVPAHSRRLESWKEIAAYLGRDVRTVQRWERRDGLPIHRLQHRKLGSVFAHTAELDTWRHARDPSQLAVRTEVAKATRFRHWFLWIGAGFSAVALAFSVSRLGPEDTRTRTDSRVRSLAVLPISDVSQHGDEGYFADGMTDALIGQLSTLRDFRVISRSSVMQFKNTHKPIPEIAQVLNVDAVVEGSVQRSGDRVRMTSRLVRADSGETLWSGSYEREMGNVLALQSEVVEVIASQIVATVTPAERARLATSKPVAPAVYESYLKGLWHLNLNLGTRKVEESIRHFAAATATDPTFAPAYVGLATAYRALGSTGVGVLPVSEAHPKTVAAATTAIGLDPQVAGGHTILADAYQEEWQWSRAEEGYRRALEINPNDVEAHARFGGLLVWLGRAEEGIAYARRARELDPLSVARTVQLGFLLYHTRQYDEAIRELRTVLAAAPNHQGALWFLGFALIDSSRLDEAIETLERLVVIRDRHPAALGLLARAYGRADRRSDALHLLDELKRRERERYVPPASFVHAYIGLGDRRNAFASLERSYRERSHIVQMLKTHPLYDPLRDDRRFVGLVRRVGLE